MNEVELRQEWEAWRQARDAEQQARHDAELRQRDAYDSIAWEARGDISGKLRDFIEAIEPYANGAAGEITVGIAATYVKALHELAALWGLTRPLRPVTPPPSREEPAAVASRTEAEQRAAVEVLRAAGFEQLGRVRQRMQLPAGGGDDPAAPVAGGVAA